MRIRRITTHTLQAVAEGSLIALLVVGLMAGTAFAGKGRPGGGGTSGLSVELVTDMDGNGSRTWSDEITFHFSTSNPYPVASLTCSQGGSVVYGDSRPMYQPNAFDDPGIFTLRSQAWDGGAASCHVTLKGSSRGKTVTLGSMDFAVGA